MGATDLRQRARRLRSEADRLEDVAIRIEAEHWGLTRAWRRMWPLFEPTTWQGPAADRAHDGAQQARRDARHAFELAAGHALELRRRARALRLEADHLEVRAREVEREAAARAACSAGATSAATGRLASLG